MSYVLKIKKQFPEIPDLQKHGDWIDLYFCGIHSKCPNKEMIEKRAVIYQKEVYYNFYLHERVILSLGVSVEMPIGFEALILPRSSLFIKYGILLGNSVALIDNDYKGNDDIWGMPVYFTQEYTRLKLFQRIAQFRIIENMPSLKIKYVEKLSNKNRDGFGHSGE